MMIPRTEKSHQGLAPWRWQEYSYTDGKQVEGDIWYGDGSNFIQEVGGRTIYRVGGAITCGPLQVFTQVTGPQTSYRAEVQSFMINSALAGANQELIYDYKAAVDHSLHRLLHPPHRMFQYGFGLTIQEEIQNKPLRSRWVPSHRDIAKAKTKERTKIKCNGEVDQLAKMAAHKGDIAVNGGPAPTPAKKWVTEGRHYDLCSGTDSVFRLPNVATLGTFFP